MTNPWITRTVSNDFSPKCRLFCFPFAGGSASTYREWAQRLHPALEVCAINLPGRGARFLESAYSDMSSLTDVLADALLPEMDRPFFFFGHSMGAMVAFELARKLRARGCELPKHLFLSARPGPLKRLTINAHPPIKDDDLVAMLMALNGTDKKVLENKELLEFMLPALRADMTLVQTHRYPHEPPLSCGITSFGGLLDPTVSKDELAQWRLQTTSSFRLHMLEGDHFFLHHQQKAILDKITHVYLYSINSEDT